MLLTKNELRARAGVSAVARSVHDLIAVETGETGEAWRVSALGLRDAYVETHGKTSPNTIMEAVRSLEAAGLIACWWEHHEAVTRLESVVATEPREPTWRGFVYLAAVPGSRHVKIGFTTSPKGRMRRLTYEARPLGVEPGRLEVVRLIRAGRGAERGLHVRFRGACVGGEWFAWTDELRAFAAEVER